MDPRPLAPWLSLLLVACVGGGRGDGPEPVFDLDSPRTYAVPWPGDQDRDPDGTIAFDRFVYPEGIGLIDDYVALGETQRGWGNNSPIHLTTAGPVPVDALPTPEESLAPGSGLVLLDVDPDSPYVGERHPVVWRVSGEVSTYQPENLLSVAPAPGFPLRPGTTYALLLTDDVFAVNPDFQEVFDRDHPHADLWRPIRSTLRGAGLPPRRIAGGTVFTTQDPLDEMRRIAAHVQNDLQPPDLDVDLIPVLDTSRYRTYRGTYDSPVFTHGERPFLDEGGAFRFSEDGTPEIASWDTMDLAVCVPRDAQPPASGWPVVVYQHGTGGDHLTPCDSDASLEFASVVGSAGFVVLSIDQPLHGTRTGGDPPSELANFNIFNPVSGQTNFRQGAADALYLARGLASPVTMRLPDGASLPLDPARVTYAGHSQGGLTGALAAPFWAGDVQATVLSGAGGLLAITIVDRKDFFDFAELVASVARFTDQETVHELHPLLGVVQTLVDRTDPINYAPYWFAESPGHIGEQPTSVLVTSGTADAATPFRTALALAAAGRLAPIAPRATDMPGIDLRGLDDAPSPAIGNAMAYAGEVTSGFSQWDQGSHFVVFQEPRAADLYRTFLRSAVDDEPTLELRAAFPEWL
jgi:alpha-beta hydrolase superfamily lysophospholipase